MPIEILCILLALGGLLLLYFLWRIYRIFSCIAQYNETAEKPFACPCCGNRFYIKWYKLIWGGQLNVAMMGNAKLKCPKCGKTDWCKWINEVN